MGAVQMLLDAGADPNFSNSNGDAPLSKAADVGDKEMTKLLLDSGADPNKCGKYGTALHQAVQKHSSHRTGLSGHIECGPQ